VVVVEPGIIQTEFGSVLVQPMMKRSGNGPYGELAGKVAQAIESSYKKGGGSSASVIAGVVSAAVRSRRPKTRYVAGKLAKPLLFVRKWLGDRMFDRMVMSAVK